MTCHKLVWCLMNPQWSQIDLEPSLLDNMYFADFQLGKLKDFQDWQESSIKSSKKKSKQDTPEQIKDMLKNEYQFCEQYQIYKCIVTPSTPLNATPQITYYKFPEKPAPKVY